LLEEQGGGGGSSGDEDVDGVPLANIPPPDALLSGAIEAANPSSVARGWLADEAHEALNPTVSETAVAAPVEVVSNIVDGCGARHVDIAGPCDDGSDSEDVDGVPLY
jgi:hypothetical protein